MEYLDLWVNSITIYDDYGWTVKNDNTTQLEIINIAKNEGNKQIFPTSTYDETVVGWFAIDEPETIDNLAVIQEIDDLINNATNGKRRLMVAMCNGWNSLFGEYGGTGIDTVFKIDEYLSRTNLKLLQLTAYLYNCPKDPETEPTWREDNIHLYNYGLNRFAKNNKDFILGLQTGKWQTDEQTGYEGVDTIPTGEQFLYNMNLGLIYGAKGISLNNYFSWERNNKVTGLCDVIDEDTFEHTP